MRVRYEHPPIVEAVCEFQFEAGEPWDWTIPGRLYEQVREGFPGRQHHPTVLAEAPAGSRAPAHFLPAPMRMRFVRADGTAMVQVGPDLLAINFLSPYPGWGAFRQAIYQGLEAYASVAEPAAIRRIGLRYINRILIPVTSPDESVEIGDYLAAPPSVPEAWRGQALRGFVQRIELAIPSAQAVLAVRSGSADTDRADCVAFLVDLDFATDLARNLPLNAAQGWIEGAHREVSGAFQACITERAEALFGRKEHAKD